MTESIQQSISQVYYLLIDSDRWIDIHQRLYPMIVFIKLFFHKREQVCNFKILVFFFFFL